MAPWQGQIKHWAQLDPSLSIYTKALSTWSLQHGSQTCYIVTKAPIASVPRDKWKFYLLRPGLENRHNIPSAVFYWSEWF